MTDQHPITPPPELIEQWMEDWPKAKVKHNGIVSFVAGQAARWTADQELEACCEWLSVFWPRAGRELRAARRPKSSSLKEQALAELDAFDAILKMYGCSANTDTIRRALERFPE